MCWKVENHEDRGVLLEDYPEVLLETEFENGPEAEDVWALYYPEYHILLPQEDKLILKKAQWGIDPYQIADEKKHDDLMRNMVNARSERILGDKRSYWYRLRKNRCLIPVSGTFEFHKIKGWQRKVPYHITEKGRKLIYIPGLYQQHEVVDADGVIHIKTEYTLITRPANSIMMNIHNDGPNKHRMPLFLTQELEHAWLSPHLNDNDMVEIFNYKLPDEKLDYHTVYSLNVKEPRPDGKHKYEPWTWQGLPTLGEDDPKKGGLELF